MRIFFGVAALGLAACQPAPTEVSTSSQIAAPVQIAPTSNSILALLNQQRASQGRGPVREDANLSRSARSHAQDMVNNDYFSHDGQNGSSFSDRARAAGYTCAAAENIAFGQRSEAEVITAWMNSPGHRRNILLGDAVEFGIGRDGNMWVLVMGRGC